MIEEPEDVSQIAQRLVFTVGLTLVPQAHLANLSTWLRALEVEPHPRSPFDTADHSDHPVQTYLYWASALLRSVLNAGHIPHFEFPEISVLNSQPNNSHAIRIRIALTKVELVPDDQYQSAVRACFEQLIHMAKLDPSQENKKRVFDVAYNRVVLPLRRSIALGQSTLHVLRVAHARGIPFIHLGLGVFQLGWGSRARVIDRSTTESDAALGARLSHDKFAAGSVLRRAGLPAPVHQVVRTVDEALAAAGEIGFPLVVKPCDQDRGVGVSTHITDEPALRQAFEGALRVTNTKRVLVERQVAGTCYRLFIAHGRLLYAVKRNPFRIWGDGERTVSQLIVHQRTQELARPPWLQDVAPNNDHVTQVALRDQGYGPQDVPAKGVAISLRPIETTAWGGYDEDVTDQVHPDNLEAALLTAKLFRLSVLGVDMISPDISMPWHFNDAIINEVNFAPLLGGAEISRGYIPSYLDGLLEGAGTIPVRFYAQDSDVRAAHRQFEQDGLRCFSVLSRQTIGSDGKEIILLDSEPMQRLRALLLRPDADAIVVSKESP